LTSAVYFPWRDLGVSGRYSSGKAIGGSSEFVSESRESILPHSLENEEKALCLLLLG